MLGSVVRTALLAATMTAAVGAPPTAQQTLALAGPIPIATATVAPTTALKEIGRVHVTSPLCKALVGDAVRAIEIETQNDRRLDEVTGSLHAIDFDSSELAKHRGTHDLTQRYVTLRAAALEGSSIVKLFRDEVKSAPTPERRSALASFADALDGALHRQKVLADDLGRLVAYLDAHEPIDAETHDAQIFSALLEENDARFPRTAFDVRAFGPTAGVPDTLSTTAHNAATELVTRAQPIASDENDASARVENAFAGC